MIKSTEDVNSWEIWIALVNFVEGDGKKARPCIILNVKESSVLALKITSSNPNKNSQGITFRLLEIDDWKSLNLLKRSFVQLDPLYEIPIEDLGEKLSDIPVELKERICELLSLN